MRNLFIILVLYSHATWAFDFQKYKEMASEKIDSIVNTVLGKEDPPAMETITLPKIPKITQTATSTDVYDKSGEIYKQGEKYNKLSLEQKRSYRLAFIQELYFVVYGAEASKEKLASMLNVLEKGGSREGIYRSLVLNNEYASLEDFDESPSEKLIKETEQIAGKFLGKRFDVNAMKQLNLFSIKKLMTEKLLEVMDAFPSDGKDLRSWYAVYSSDLAKAYKQIWQGPIRGVVEREPHFRWAGSVPLQHIKSEVIIKTHKLMNFLQK